MRPFSLARASGCPLTERDAICNDRLFAALLYSIMKGKMSPLYSDWLSQELLSCVSNAWSSLGM